MSIESAKYINNLDVELPKPKDLIREGDDHIRLIKEVLKNTLQGFNSAVTVTSDKLNQFDKTFVYENEVLVSNSDIKMGAKKVFDAGGNRIKGVADPTEDGDAIPFKYGRETFQGNAWPVGSIYMTMSNADITTIFKFGKWERFATGRMIVSAGAGVDVNGTTKVFGLGELGGEYTHAIKEAEIPSHVHSSGGLSTNVAGEHTHTFKQLDIRGPGPDTKHGFPIAQMSMANFTTAAAGGHQHMIIGNTGATGGSVAMSMMPTYVAVNMWRRTE
ncbi:collar domain containing protein/baseplate wedge protein [Aeromonas phage BUCT695]|uniref:collar domain containing protein/baseplate wedge protein n=1 Tax=Aeromonas phage BUCT695 TaxID=2908630 RepID=UPI0023298B79|nr:collar domain containing protein/baseplate wedge protein [Aeromonas phage BUCT695]UIW10591.1 collar domain containing protein/baseplate wedge protein [Aeromonas phage BUCT695]